MRGTAPNEASGVTVTEIEQSRDERGMVYEPLPPEAISDQRNVHVVFTEPGCVRGNHLHREATEILTVTGPARVRYREEATSGIVDVDVPHGATMAFRIPPGIAHAVANTGSEPNVLVAFQDRPHDPENPDTERVELL